MRKQDRSQIIKFQRDIQGMTMNQQLEYLRIPISEREKYILSIRPSNIVNQQEKGKDKKNGPVKIIKPGQVSICVLNMRGKPLMPCSPRKAKILLRTKKARVIRRNPFTIQLKYATGEAKQPIIFALDPGYKNVGFSAVTEKRELISGEVTLRTDIPEKLLEKKMYRRGRRNRNTRYREPRWKNRGNKKGKKEGWLAPSIQHKLDTYVRLVDKFQHGLPISHINIETSPFDMQKMMNVEISGIEYQQGELQGYEVKEYLLDKWNRKCAYCKKENVPFETEHIIPTSRGGTNRVSNLTIACHDCNQEKGNLTATEFGHPEIQLQARQSLKAATFMNVVRSRLVDKIKKEFPDLYVDSTYGYITKYNRIKSGLEKTHANDAFIIANSHQDSDQIRSKPYTVKQIRRNNRQLQMNRKGFKPSIRTKRYKYSYGDLVIKQSSIQTSGWGEKANKKDKIVYSSKGVFNYGEWLRLENPQPGEKDISINSKDAKILKYGSGLLFQLLKDKGDKIIMTEKVKKLSKKEQKIIDMQGYKSIEDAWK